MSQFDYIKEIAKHGLDNDQEGLLHSLNELIEYSKKTKKTNFALQLQSILKEGIRNRQTTGLSKVGSTQYLMREEDKQLNDFIIEKVTSDYRFENLVAPNNVMDELHYFVSEHQMIDTLQNYNLPVSNKVIFYGPSGCGKTLASYVLAGELKKIMLVINLGSVVSSKLGETSKNLAKIFRRAVSEETIIFIDEFDSLGKVRDYNQDHGEMKRVVNTILQLIDYLPQNNIVIAATNQVEMIDEALLRRFDLKVKLDLPTENQIIELIDKTLQNERFILDKNRLSEIIEECKGLSFYNIQRTLITAIKRTLLKQKKELKISQIHIDVDLWLMLLKKERTNI